MVHPVNVEFYFLLVKTFFFGAKSGNNFLSDAGEGAFVFEEILNFLFDIGEISTSTGRVERLWRVIEEVVRVRGCVGGGRRRS